nr:STAS/SEC14 domain-containing protein [uncultured Holophaga sp.]
MTLETVLENAHISVWYDSESGIVRHRIHRHTSGAILREATEAGIELLRRHGACKWLSDDRNNGPLAPEDLAWAHEVFGPRAVAAGWRFWALVTPERAVAHMNMRKFQDTFARLGVAVRTFSDPEEAAEWLRRC